MTTSPTAPGISRLMLSMYVQGTKERMVNQLRQELDALKFNVERAQKDLEEGGRPLPEQLVQNYAANLSVLIARYNDMIELAPLVEAALKDQG